MTVSEAKARMAEFKGKSPAKPSVEVFVVTKVDGKVAVSIVGVFKDRDDAQVEGVEGVQVHGPFRVGEMSEE
jgi:hypothetical protein